MRFVPVKTAEQQAALMLVGVRDRLIRNRTQIEATPSVAMRAGSALPPPRGSSPRSLLERIHADESLPGLARSCSQPGQEYAQLQAQIDEVDAGLMAWHHADECSRRLTDSRRWPDRRGPATMKTPEPELFRSGRQFAAWIGLDAERSSTAGKARLGGITRAGDEGLRSVWWSGRPP